MPASELIKDKPYNRDLQELVDVVRTLDRRILSLVAENSELSLRVAKLESFIKQERSRKPK